MVKYDISDLGENIRRIRKERGLSLEDLSRMVTGKANVKRFRDYELGHRIPRSEILFGICEACNCLVTDLVKEMQVESYDDNIKEKLRIYSTKDEVWPQVNAAYIKVGDRLVFFYIIDDNNKIYWITREDQMNWGVPTYKLFKDALTSHMRILEECKNEFDVAQFISASGDSSSKDA